MADMRWLRLVDVVRRQMSAVDARVEVGGQPPGDPRAVFCPLSDHVRVVAILADPPADRDEAVARLRSIVESFHGIASSIVQRVSIPPAPSASSLLDEELQALCARTGAVVALIYDASSPVIWASSEALPDGFEDVQGAVRFTTLAGQAAMAGVDLPSLLDTTGTAANDAALPASVPDVLAHAVRATRAQCPDVTRERWRRYALAARAISEARHVKFDAVAAGEAPADMVQQEQFGWLTRPFAAIYRLLLVFDKPYSELATRGAVVRALPWIERLVLSLPPTDPGTAAGQVVRMRRPKK
jgi:hypothetical protein